MSMAWASKKETCKGSKLLCFQLLDMVLDTNLSARKRELLLTCSFHSAPTTSNAKGVPKQGFGQHRGPRSALKAFSEANGSLKLEQHKHALQSFTELEYCSCQKDSH